MSEVTSNTTDKNRFFIASVLAIQQLVLVKFDKSEDIDYDIALIIF